MCDEIIARRGGQPADDLLGLLAAARGEDGERLDATELRDQVLIFLLAGHETTATALTFALHLLGKHPDEQQRVREEVDALLGDGHRPTAEDYNALPQLTRVLKESMRLFPAAPAVRRRSVADCVVDGTRDPGRLGRTGLRVRDAPSPPSLGGPGALRPRPLHPRAGGGPAPLRLVPLRRRPALLHRPALLDARVGARAGDAAARLRGRGGRHRGVAQSGASPW